MKYELENLWCSYLCEKTTNHTKEEKELINRLISAEKDFLSTLNSEQKVKFNTYDNILQKINHISEKNAFTKGVVFTTRFFIETLND